MTRNATRMRTRHAAVTTLLAVGLLATGQPPAGAAGGEDPVPALERHAHPLSTTDPGEPLNDVRPFGRMIGDASVVTVGEATHSSREFTTMHQRLFGFLAQQKGFGSFAREISWSTGLLLDRYVQTGVGDPGTIMDRELETFYQVFDTEEFLEFVESLRRYNAVHDDPLHIVGMDLAFPGNILFNKIDRYLAEHHPRLRKTISSLYDGLAPDPGQHLGDYQAAYQGQSLRRRETLAVQARSALRLLRSVAPDPDSPHREAYEWTLQHARSIAQVAVQYSFDTQTAEGMARWGAYRDRRMADNVMWWREHTDDKTMISAMNVHASYRPIDPGVVPTTLGSHLRKRLDDDHVNVGFSFAEGSTNSLDPDGGHGPHEVKAEPRSNEHTLARVRHDQYVIDLRNAPRPARRWLSSTRPTFNIGGHYDPDDSEDGLLGVSLGASYDVLFHLDEVQAATPRFVEQTASRR